MDKLKITRYKESFDAIANYIENEQKDQVEIWFARELQTVLGYARWENFVVAILDKFDALVNDISVGLPAEIEARRKQYQYYRNRLLTFKEKTA